MTVNLYVHVSDKKRLTKSNHEIMTIEILDLNELANLLGRSAETIKKDMLRNHLAVPPRLHIPGTRLLRWRKVDVAAWLASHVERRNVEGCDDQKLSDSK